MRANRFVGSLLALGAMLYAGTGQAVGYIAATAGKAYNFSEQGFFIHYTVYGGVGMIDQSAQGRFWNTDVPVTSTGSKTLAAYGRSRGTGIQTAATSCAAIVMDGAGSLSSWTGHVSLVNSGTPNSTTLGALTINTGNTLQFECYISSNIVAGQQGFVGRLSGW